jgi:isoquinoline 1-oxidoreductase beta subunit
MKDHIPQRKGNTTTLSRRTFIKKTAGFTFAISASGFITTFGPTPKANAASEAEAAQPNIWVTINPDNSIIAKYAGTELGQGSMTFVPMMLAEYLDADWDKVKVEIVAVHDTAFGNPIFQNWLYTAGSTQIAVYKNKMAMAGTQARKMLLMAVAKSWGVDITELTTEPSIVVHQASGRRISYGDIVATMALAAEPPEVDKSEFKSPENYRYIGKPVQRRDVPGKSDGSMQYAIDLQIPGMAYAAIKRTPVEGERPLEIDDAKARSIEGIIDIVTLPWGVAVVGETVEATQKAKSVLNVTWSEESPIRKRSSEEFMAEYSKNARDLTISGTPWIMVKGDAKATLDKADHVYDALYTSDPAYHAQMEPLNAIAAVSDDGKSAEIWVGTQSQSTTIIGSAETLGTTIDKIKLHPIMMGGAYGRRGLVHADYVDDALLVSKAMKRPIKVIWSREDDVEAPARRLRQGRQAHCRTSPGKLSGYHSHHEQAPLGSRQAQRRHCDDGL